MFFLIVKVFHCIVKIFYFTVNRLFSKYKGCGLYTGAGYTLNLKTYSSNFGGCGLYTGAGNTPVITVLYNQLKLNKTYLAHLIPSPPPALCICLCVSLYYHVMIVNHIDLNQNCFIYGLYHLRFKMAMLKFMGLFPLTLICENIDEIS